MNLLPSSNRRPLVPVLAGLLACSLPQANGSVVCGPMLQGATTTTIYVLAECTLSASSPMTVNFGITAGYGANAATSTTRTTTASPATYIHVIKLTGLQPNTLYHYQLTGQGVTPADNTFRTLVNPGTPFRFAWTADFRDGVSVHNQICERIRLNHNSPTPPLFDLTGGDYASDNSDSNWKSQWLSTVELTLEKGLPTYLSPGNHDGWGGDMQAYDQPPDSSGTNGYYSFDCGDLHVIVGNYQDPAGYGVGSAQYNWIQQDVQASLKPWKIMGFHAPAYTYGSHGNDTGLVTITTNLLEPNGVKVVLAGHNHFYQRNLINGISHITCGAAGAPLYSVGSGTGTQRAVSDNCYLIADVTPTTLNMLVYNNIGTQLDTISLTKPAAPAGLAATAGTAQAALTWNAVSGATGYTVYYGTANAGPYPSKKTVTTTNTTVTGLTNDTPYFFVVTASDANGPSAISAQATATPILIKAASGASLAAVASWSGGVAPTASNTAVWDATSLGAGLSLNSAVGWKGVAVTGAISDIAVTGTGPLTLGQAGFDLSSSTVNMAWGTPLALAANQSWQVNSGKTLTVSGAVTAASGYSLTKTGGGTLVLSASNNTYPGITSVGGGTLLVNGTLATAAAAVTINPGSKLGGSGPIQRPLTINGSVAPGNNGAGTLAVTGTTALNGTLAAEIDGAAADKLAVTGNLILGAASALTVNLLPGGFTQPNYVIAECSGGTLSGTFASVPAGFKLTYNSTQALLAQTGFNGWANRKGITSGPNGDDDQDGLANLLEYALGLDPKVPNGSPGVIGADGTITFTKGPDAIAAGDLTYVIQESDDLGKNDPWTAVATQGPGNTDPTISYLLPAGSPEKFARLLVTKTP